MNKIQAAFQEKKAFIAYLMAGDPDLDTSAQYILAAQEAGADLIEIGIPFSDPIAEGPVIQQASLRALSSGARLDKVLEMVASLKENMRIPLVFMTYLNPVFVYGYDRFFEACSRIGIIGIIIPDLPLEHKREVSQSAGEHGVAVISLVAPTSAERIGSIAKEAEGFLYLVSSMGVTGVRKKVGADIDARVQELRQVTAIPIAAGFGIATPEQAAQYAKHTDGVIVGSAIVSLIAKHGANAHTPLRAYIGEMKKSILNL